MAKITADNLTTAQKAIWEAWADRQEKTSAELANIIVVAHIGEFAREMGIDVSESEEDQLEDLQRKEGKRAAKKAARIAEADAARIAAEASAPSPEKLTTTAVA